MKRLIKRNLQNLSTERKKVKTNKGAMDGTVSRCSTLIQEVQ